MSTKYSAAQNRATQKFLKSNYSEITIRQAKQKNDMINMVATIREYCATRNISIASFVISAAQEKIARDNLLPPEERPWDI